MNKSSYIATAAKYLAIVSAILFVSNLLTNIGTWVPFAAVVSKKSYIITLIVTTLLAFVAFNGEGLGHKRSLEHSGKNAERILKLLLAVSFTFFYVKNRLVESVFAHGETWRKLGLSVLTVTASFSFVLCAVSVWYVIRDGKKPLLRIVDIFVLALSLVYTVYKFFYYSVVSYGIFTMNDVLTALLASNTIMQVLCLMQYAADIFMCVLAYRIYSQQSETEEKKLSEERRQYPVRNAYNKEFFGVDTLEDDWLVSAVRENETENETE